MAILSVIDRAVASFDCELKIVDMELAHPERFVRQADRPVSNVRWAVKGAKAKIMELAIGLFRLGELAARDGTELQFIDIVKALELAFNVDLHTLYIQKGQLLSRKKSSTPFLRRLIAIVEQEAEDAFK